MPAFMPGIHPAGRRDRGVDPRQKAGDDDGGQGDDALRCGRPPANRAVMPGFMPGIHPMVRRDRWVDPRHKAADDAVESG